MQLPAGDVSVALEELTRLFRRLAPLSGLSLTAAATLSSLDRRGPARLTELAVQEGVSQPAMTQLITRLQDAGLAGRLPDPDDGRVVRVHITDAGRAQLAHRRAVRTERLATLLDRLTAPEQEKLTAALPAITALTRLAAEPGRAEPERSTT
ncbi:MAG: MarR family transcriptional regulator [Actinophytocola sp.]|uniref:MarR family transcriptional regulator n=1 Tax=Actinophytocola sp. TaxID=1872138 RepID=UPI00132531F7|nr:MarR family transcriptional regulator [Actinophytocola sp.]MPZ83776.1 MarR family transcriptional regulator [Actinophytocola sp.]